jgi:hypothetical protein
MAGAIAVGVGAWAHLRLERFLAASLLLLTTAVPSGYSYGAYPHAADSGYRAAVQYSGYYYGYGGRCGCCC